ncbi:macoilin [Eurytemora carolleeae]|uniref:macoilin n=1 Tax=Eurytemora carolleeae TaxID=1294199 RepID=UPI000C76E24B|nr:macoilin [Eurytemora carolleeae]|eukprot:XP_023336290.1 macoilin-like [Eurytemora affinis]
MKTSCFPPPYLDPISCFTTSREFVSSGNQNMKRRTPTDGKRRPVKRTKISDNFLGSTLVYVKLLLLWLVVLVADYFLEFRFEYLWPFWLLVRSIYDSFKYQGLAFSVFFICIALTSDMICFLFIPVHWLFFAASTYVWVQYVWHTEKGICLPTVFLWLLFVYIEAAVRLRDYKLNIDVKNLPFHLDLCRPFAAHCGSVKENETYFSLLRSALPPGPAREDAFNPQPSPKPGKLSYITLSTLNLVLNKVNCPVGRYLVFNQLNGSASKNGGGGIVNGDVELCYMERREEEMEEAKHLARSNSKSNGAGAKDVTKKVREEKKPENHFPLVIKLESDVKRLKCDLQLSRNRENELREQIVCYMSSERSLKSEISSLLVEKSTLEARINSLISSRAGEKQTLSSLEKKLTEEKRQRAEFQLKLETERKNKKEANAERAVAMAQHNVNSGTIAKLETEIARLKDELSRSEQRALSAEEEIKGLRKNTHGDPEKLKVALTQAQDQQCQLEKTLSAESKVKMELFSALGAAKRRLQMNEGMLMNKDREILELKGNIAELLAVMPGTQSLPFNGMGSGGHSAAPGGFPATTRASASSGLFIPNSLDHGHMTGEASMSDLPAGIELSKLTGLGLADLEDKLASYEKSSTCVTSSMYTPTTYSVMNGSLNEA